MPDTRKEISYRRVPGITDPLYYRDDTARDAIDSIDENICAAYDESETYEVGDLTLYNHQLYKCVTAVNPVTAAYIVGSTALANGWLSLTEGGTAISETSGTASTTVYKVETDGNYEGKTYSWNGTAYEEVTLSEAFDVTKWVRVSLQGLYEGLGDYAHKSGAAVIITEDDTTPPADTTVLWVYPES